MIGERLKLERERLGLNQPEFAEYAGAKKRTLIDWEKNVSSPTAVQLSALAAIGVNVQFVLVGDEELRIKEQRNHYGLTDYCEIPHYNIQAAAGAGALPINEEQLKPLAFRRDWLAGRHLSPAALVIVDVKGESMEPKLQDGDLVLVDKSQTDISSGKTYVLRMDGHLLVKNLQLLPHGLVQVASFNMGFPAYQVDLSDESLDMAVIGRVVASMHEW